MVVGVIRLHGNNTLTLPKHLREAMGIKPGCLLKLVVENERLVVIPTNDKELAGTGFKEEE